jgi:hypothetical protein
MTWTIKLCGNPSKVLAEIMADEKVPASVRLLVEDEIGEIPFSFDSVIVAGCGNRGSSLMLLVEPFNSGEAAPERERLFPFPVETPAEVIPVTAATTASASAPADEDEEPTKFSTEPCPVCKGTGSTIPGSGIPCERCRGTGKVKTIVF